MLSKLQKTVNLFITRNGCFYIVTNISDRGIKTEEEALLFDEYSNLMLHLMGIYYENSLSEKTIRKHKYSLFGLFMYASGMLELHATDCLRWPVFDCYFDDWYISHDMSSSVQTTKDGIAAVKKYALMLEALGLIDQTHLKAINTALKNGKEEWLENMAMFDDEDIPYREYCIRVHGYDPGDVD